MAVEVEDIGETMLELGDAALGGGGTREVLLIQGMEGAADGVFIEFHDRIAIGFLIGSVQQRVQGEGVVFGGGDLLFHEGAKDAGFGRGQKEVHGGQ